ncbi:MAG: hypothetical protein V1646_00615 [bacterium]
MVNRIMRVVLFLDIFVFAQTSLIANVDKERIDSQNQKLDEISRSVTETIRNYSDPDLRDTERGRFVEWFKPKITGGTVIGDINTAIGFLTGCVSSISTRDIGEVNKKNLDDKRKELYGIIEMLDEIYARCVNTRNILAPTGYFMIELQRLFLGQLGVQKVSDCFEGIIPLEMAVSEKINELLRYWQEKLSEIARQGEKERERVREMQEQAARRIAEEEQRRAEMARIEQERAREEEARKEQEMREREALDAMQKRQEELAKAADEAQKKQAEELRKQRDAFEGVKADLRRIIDEMKANKAIAEAHKNPGIPPERKPKKTPANALNDFAKAAGELKPLLTSRLNDATAPLFLEAFEIMIQAINSLWDSVVNRPKVVSNLEPLADFKSYIRKASGRDIKAGQKSFSLLNWENEKALVEKCWGVEKIVRRIDDTPVWVEEVLVSPTDGQKLAIELALAPKPEPAPELPKREHEKKPIPGHKPAVEKKDEDAPPPLPAREDRATKALKGSLSSLKTSLQELKYKTELLQGKLVLLKDRLS